MDFEQHTKQKNPHKQIKCKTTQTAWTIMILKVAQIKENTPPPLIQ